jgi:hypothetical protein
VEKQNITLSWPKTLLRRAKIMAVKKEKSMSQFLTEALEEKVRDEKGYRRAKERQMRILMKGFDLGTGGRMTASREELHDRR